MAESQFNKKLRQAMAIRGIKMYRVESHGTSPGMPDNFYLIIGMNNETGWLEVKDVPIGQLKKIPWRPHQVPWLLQYAEQGGRCGTVVRVGSVNSLVFIPGKRSNMECDKGLPYHPDYGSFWLACTLDKPEACWDWLARLLKRSPGNF